MMNLFSFTVLRNGEQRPLDDSRWVDLYPADIGLLVSWLPEQERAQLREQLINAPGAIGLRDGMSALMALVTATGQGARVARAREILGSPLAVNSRNEAGLYPPVLDLNRWLRSVGNAPADAQFQAKLAEIVHARSLGAELRALITRPEFWSTLGRLAATIGAGLALARDLAAWPPEERARVTRLFMVASLLLRWFARGLGASPKEDVAVFLREARIRVPAALLSHLKLERNLVRRPAFADHFVVEQEWDRYELGEVADVENVMAGESRKRSYRRTTENEVASQESREQSIVEERELQASERSELASAAREEQNMHVAANADVTTKFQIGTSTTVAQIGGAFDYSTASAKETASKHAREIMERARTRVEERITKARQTRSLVRTVESNERGFENTQAGASHKLGIYRWVEKIDSVRLMRYPGRLVVEFVVPEPGAWLQEAMRQRVAAQPGIPPPPAWPTWLTGAEQIIEQEGSSGDYRVLARHFGAQGVPTKPAPQTVGVSVKRDVAETDKWIDNLGTVGGLPAAPIVYSTPSKVAVPTGQRALRWTANVLGHGIKYNMPAGSSQGRIYVMVGAGRGISEAQNANGERMHALSGVVGAISEGEIPVQVADSYSFGCAASIVIECEPTEEAIKAWQQTVFDILLESYQRKQTEYQGAVEAAAFSASSRSTALSPGFAREVARAELKRAVVQLLAPETVLGGTALRLDSAGDLQIDPAVAQQRAPQVLFFEEAFEWPTLSYVLYPYYWGSAGRWKRAATTESGNPEYDRFIAAGSARVVVAVRPGFESQVQFFLDYGAIWGGLDVPAPGESGYLSVADEIVDMQRKPRDGELVDGWDVRLPTSFVALDPGAAFPLQRPPPP